MHLLQAYRPSLTLTSECLGMVR